MRETCPLDADGVQQWFDATSNACGEQAVDACAGVPVCDVYDGNCHDAEDFFVTPTPEPDFKCPVADGWFEDPANCIKYYRCDSFVADHRTCDMSGRRSFTGCRRRRGATTPPTWTAATD